MEILLLIAAFVVLILAYILIAGLGCSSTVVQTNFSDTNLKEATIYYYLPESLIKITATTKVAVVYNAGDNTLTDSSRIIEQEFKIVPEIIADTRSLLALNYKPNVFATDVIKYAVNSKGLLETVNVTTEDETAAIFTKLAEAPQAIFRITSKGSVAPEVTVKVKEYQADFVMRISELSDTEFTWNIILINELKDEAPKSIRGDFQVRSDERKPNGYKRIEEILSGLSAGDKNIDGILCRPYKNLMLRIKPFHLDPKIELPVNTTVIDTSKLIHVPIKRTPFVKRINTLSLKNGMLISNEINKPSPVKGAFSIPIDIVKAIVSIPGQLVKFRIDNTQKLTTLETEKQNLEAALHKRQQFELTREQDIEKIRLDIEKNELQKKIELEKMQHELEKSLLEAEKNKLQATRELDALKDEIKKLKERSS